MACCTIPPPTQKRGLEFDLPRSKRRKCGTMYTLQQAATATTTSINSQQPVIIDANAKKLNPFQLSPSSLLVDNNELVERIRNEAKRYMKRRQLTTSTTTTTTSTLESTATTSTSSTGCDYRLANNLPLFSIEQVSQICEKMLKEREERLKEQYDVILSKKLSEQYDAFVKFTHEQIQKRFEASNFSYVS